jgi:hypothetical protein
MTSIAMNKKQRVTIFLNPLISKQAKAEAVIQEITLTSLIEKALVKYLPKETVIKKVVIK